MAAHQVCARAQARARTRWDLSVEDVLSLERSSRGVAAVERALAVVWQASTSVDVTQRSRQGTSVARPRRVRRINTLAYDSPPSGGGSFHEEEEVRVIAGCHGALRGTIRGWRCRQRLVNACQVGSRSLSCTGWDWLAPGRSRRCKPEARNNSDQRMLEISVGCIG